MILKICYNIFKAIKLSKRQEMYKNKLSKYNIIIFKLNFTLCSRTINV